jgi:hypothetical protein
MGSVHYAPLISSDEYDIPVTGFSIQGASGVVDIAVPTASQNALLDSGGPWIFVPDDVRHQLITAIAGTPAFAQTFGDASWFDGDGGGAIMATPAQIDAMLPPLKIQVGGPQPFTLQLPASTSYMVWYYALGSGYYYVPSLRSSAALQSLAIDLGGLPMMTYLTIFDRSAHRVGFAPAPACQQ